MKRAIAGNSLAMLLFCLMLAAAAPSKAVTRELLAHGTDQFFWSADVNPNSSPDAPSAVLTTIRLRTAGDQLKWSSAGELAETPVSLSNRGSELLMVLDDGEWKIVSETDVRSGSPLPNNARVMALAGEGDDIWAIGAL